MSYNLLLIFVFCNCNLFIYNYFIFIITWLLWHKSELKLYLYTNLHIYTENFTLFTNVVEFAIVEFSFRIDEGVGVGSKSVHLSVARRDTPVGEEDQAGVGCFWSQGNHVPEHVVVGSHVGFWIPVMIRIVRKTSQLNDIININ